MPDLTYLDHVNLIELIDNLPESECHPTTLALREKLVARAHFMLNCDD